MEEGFYSVNDYTYVLPLKYQHGYSHLKELIDFLFQENELLFCLVEIVTIKNSTGVGSMHIYSSLPGDLETACYEKYKDIIREIKLSNGINASEFVEWYKTQKSYFYIKENKAADTNRFINEIPRWGGDWVPKNNGDRNLSFTLKKGLSDAKKFQYLNEYVEKLESDLKFSNFPHFAVIIKPISVINKVGSGKVYPLGNLYLHFATLDRKEEPFYIELINKFLIVWFNQYGSQLIQEIQDAAVEKIEDSGHLPKFFSKKASSKLIEKHGESDYSYQDFFDMHKNYSAHKEDFKKNQEHIKNQLIPYLIHDKIKNNRVSPPVLGLDDYQRKGSRHFKDIHNETDFNLFIDLLLIRQIFFLSYLLFGVDVENIHSFLTGGPITAASKIDPDNIYNYIWVNLLIPIGKNERDFNTKERKNKILKHMTDEEMAFIKESLDIIKTYLTPEMIIDFNKISHIKIDILTV